jgi:hypothetical protein
MKYVREDGLYFQYNLDVLASAWLDVEKAKNEVRREYRRVSYRNP